jgi:vanillate O-demethylase monooxygenase subunit
VYWHAPSAVIHPFGCKIPDNPDAGVSALSAHFFTPETDTTTHYFYHNTRDYQVDSAEADAEISELLERVFTTQDVPMIEAQQRVIGNVDLMNLHPVVLQTDRATVLMRRVLSKLIAKEEAGADTANAPVAAGAGSRSG